MKSMAWLLAVVLVLAVRVDGPEGGPGHARDQHPQRIISLVPAVTEMLFAIGAGDQVIGISSFDRYPPEALTRTRLGALVDPDVERILSLRPDLVVVYGTQDDLIARLSRADIALFSYEHAGLADITATIRRLGDRIGRRDEALRVVADIDAGIEAVRRRMAGRPRPRTVLVFEREPGSLRGMFASAGHGFLHDMLDVAGGENIFGDVDRQSLQVSMEVLLARAPDVVIELQPAGDWTPERLARERALWNTLSGLPAVRHNRVHILVNSALPVPGPRVLQGIRLLADALHAGTGSR
ncbi:MAG TPA: helical backbone metal receptor [Vicinamibacterales bacterium]|nr:helical backbone metal receptor [Vicinamibacterales bacterium]